jgi:hypothetical protein
VCGFSCRMGQCSPALRNRRLGAASGVCQSSRSGMRHRMMRRGPISNGGSRRVRRRGGRYSLWGYTGRDGATCRQSRDIGLCALRSEALLQLHGWRGRARRGSGVYHG